MSSTLPTHYIGFEKGQSHQGGDTMEVAHGISASDRWAFGGTTVLALGAGIQRWEEYFFSAFPDCPVRVINIDPFYGESRHAERPVQFGERIADKIAGIGQKLPIRSGRVDAIFSSWSQPLIYAENCSADYAEQEIIALASEMRRVLRLGGTFSLSPVEDRRAEHELQEAQRERALRCFRSVGFDCWLRPWISDRRENRTALNRLSGRLGGV